MSVVIGNTSANNHAQLANGVFNAPVTFLAHSETRPEAALKSCRNAIFSTDPGIDRDLLIHAKGERTPGTCEWIVRHGTYEAWLRGDINLLWIRGGPGKGKTMISIFLTQQLAKVPHRNLVYYFCSGERHDATTVLRGLIWQLVDMNRELTTHALPLMEPPERCKATLSSSETLWNLFRTLVSSMNGKKVHVLIDGLDECNDKSGRWLASRLARYGREAAMCNMSIVVLSRHMTALEASNTIRLDPDHNLFVSADVKAYIKTRVDDLSLQLDLTEDHQEYIVHKLLQKSEGTFLWVGFVMEELFMKDTVSEVMTAIEDLPTGLPAFYARMLRGIKPAHRELSVRLLTWLIITFRPPTIETLMDVLRCPTQEGISQRQATLDHIKHCAPMLVMQDQGVGFVHQSAKDCLLRSTAVLGPALEAFHVDLASAHLHATQRCLEALMEGTYLQYYALLNWPKHAKSLGHLTSTLFEQGIPFFERQSEVRDCWWRKYSHNFRGIPENPPPRLHIACFLGFDVWIQVILSEEEANDSSSTDHLYEKCCNDWTPLQYAAEGAHDATTALLLRSGPPDLWWDAVHELYLRRANTAEYEGMVRSLLTRGADLGRLLLKAVETGDAGSLRVFTKSNPDYKLSTTELGKWLRLARERRYSAVMEAIIECGADPDIADHLGRTLLHYAVSTENEGMTSILLAHNADPNVKDCVGRTPLHAAAESGALALVRILLSGGANTSILNGRSETARVIAARRRHAQVLEELLMEGVGKTPSTKRGLPSYGTVSSAELGILMSIVEDWNHDGFPLERYPSSTESANSISDEISAVDDSRERSALTVHRALKQALGRPWLSSLTDDREFQDRIRSKLSYKAQPFATEFSLLADNADEPRSWSVIKYPRRSHWPRGRRDHDLSNSEPSDCEADPFRVSREPLPSRFTDMTVTTHLESSFQGALCGFLYGKHDDDDHHHHAPWLLSINFCPFLTLEADIDDHDRKGRTFLSLVVQRDLTSLVHMALDFGADPNLPDTSSLPTLWGDPVIEWTPLMHAIDMHDETSVRLLLARGADPNCQDEDAWTPLLQAIYSDAPISLVQILLDGNAKPNLSEFVGESPMSLAVRKGRPDVISLLRARRANVSVPDLDRGSPWYR